MSQYVLLKQAQLLNNASTRINHHLHCFRIVTALDNLRIRFTCAIKWNYACFLKFTLMLNYFNTKNENHTFFLILLLTEKLTRK